MDILWRNKVFGELGIRRNGNSAKWEFGKTRIRRTGNSANWQVTVCAHPRHALSSLDFVYNRFLMKLFQTNNINIVNDCMSFYSCQNPDISHLSANIYAIPTHYAPLFVNGNVLSMQLCLTISIVFLFLFIFIYFVILVYYRFTVK